MNNELENKARYSLIKEIEGLRSSRVLSYITGDRAPFTTQIADDVIRIIKKHLDTRGKQKRISLFLYSRGGDMITPLRLCKLIREYTDEFEVLVPYRAHSAATLICLGANKVVMGRSGELSPIDPSTGHPFNPIDPSDPNKQRTFPISVEDLTAYFLLAKEKANVKDEHMVTVFNELTNKIHPLALGNIYRGYRMIRYLARKLLRLHMSKDDNIDKIIKKLTEDLCIHGYLITRDEAKEDLGLDIEFPKEELEEVMWKLYEQYEIIMELGVPFDPLGLLRDKQLTSFEYHAAYIESVGMTDVFVYKVETKKSGEGQVAVNISPTGWIEIFRKGA